MLGISDVINCRPEAFEEQTLWHNAWAWRRGLQDGGANQGYREERRNLRMRICTPPLVPHLLSHIHTQLLFS